MGAARFSEVFININNTTQNSVQEGSKFELERSFQNISNYLTNVLISFFMQAFDCNVGSPYKQQKTANSVSISLQANYSGR